MDDHQREPGSTNDATPTRDPPAPHEARATRTRAWSFRRGLRRALSRWRDTLATSMTSLASTHHNPAPSAAYVDLAPVILWMRDHALALEDMERLITDACRADGGATPSDIVRTLVNEHGFNETDEGHIRWLTAWCDHIGTIQRVGARRYRANTPPPRPHVTALVSIPLDEYDLIRPYVWRGRPAWETGG